MLPLDYAQDVPHALIEILEHHGKRLGVSLTALEKIGRDLALVEAFILHCEHGLGPEFALAVEYDEAAPALIPATPSPDADPGVTA